MALSFDLDKHQQYSKSEIFKTIHDDNHFMFAIFKFLGLLFMVGGFACFGGTLDILFSWIPFLGEIWETFSCSWKQ